MRTNPGEFPIAYDITRVDSKDNSPSVFGVVTGFYNFGGIAMSTFDKGLLKKINVGRCQREPFSTDSPKASVITDEEYIFHLEKCFEKINSEIEKSGLAGACWASRQFSLARIIENVKEQASKGKDAHYGLISQGYKQFPNTGVYVICESTCNDLRTCSSNPSEVALEGLTIIPRPPTFSAHSIVQEWFGRKFGSIKIGENRGHGKGPIDRGGGICNAFYFAYEVPEPYTELITSQPHFSLNFKKIRLRRQINKQQKKS